MVKLRSYGILKTICIPLMLFAFCMTACSLDCEDKAVESASSPESNNSARFGGIDFPINRPVIITNHAFLSEKDEGAVITITGMLSGNKENGFVLKEDPWSRSVVYFYLQRDENSADVYDTLSSYSGSTVTISGVLIDASAMWTKEMSVVSVK